MNPNRHLYDLVYLKNGWSESVKSGQNPARLIATVKTRFLILLFYFIFEKLNLIKPLSVLSQVFLSSIHFNNPQIEFLALTA